MRYRILKTAEGRRFRVRMSESETAERVNYWLAVTVLPFVASALMTLIWIKGA